MKTINSVRKLFPAFSRKNKGYTLVELIVVLVIVSTIAGAVSFSVGTVNQDTRLYNATSAALADIRYAQETAMTRRREVLFTINQSGNKYEARFIDDSSLLPSPTGGSGGLTVTLNSGDYAGVNITYTQRSTVRFSKTGEPLTSSGGGFGSNPLNVMQLNAKFNLYVFPSGYTVINHTAGGCGCGGC